MLRNVLTYGLLLAGGAAGLQWVEYQIWARAHPFFIYAGLGAAGFLALGVWVGAHLFKVRTHGVFQPNHAAKAALGISGREFEVLRLLAAGRSNKQIAKDLDVSPNTVKTHIARLFEKLEASRRTEAIMKARELGLIP